MAEVVINAGAFLAEVSKAAAVGLNAAAAVAQREIQRTLNLGGPGAPSAPGQPPHNQSGQLHGHWWINLADASGATAHADLVARVVSGSPQAKWMEFGAHIRPKNGKAIAIPLNAEVRRLFLKLGVRGTIEALKADKARPVVQVLTKSGLMFARKLSKGQHGPIEPLILLTDHADIKPRPFVQRSLAAARDGMQRAFGSGFRRAFSKSVPGGIKPLRGGL